jgi:hypothetical protein
MYLFFVRAFNDIDHMTPVVWKMSMNKHPVTVYCINPEYDIKKDYRLNFLQELGIKVDYIYNDFNKELGLFHRMIRFLFLNGFAVKRQLSSIERSPSSASQRMLRKVFHKLGTKSYELAKKRFYDMHWACKVIELSCARVLCFDWVRPKQYIADVFLRAAKEMSVPTLGLPHGIFVYTGSIHVVGSTKERTFEKFNSYDHIIIQNERCREVIAASGVNKDKMVVLGSARYCEEWLEQNRKILPRTIKSNGRNARQLRVVFMTTQIRYGIHTERMLKSFDIFSKFTDIEVIIKPHTRAASEAYLYENLSLPVAWDVSSVELCEWADVVMVIGSSIIVEALSQDKPTLYLKYLHENATLYEEYGACWIINDEAELQDALLSLQAGKADLPYAAENVKRFLEEVIYGDRNRKDVLRDYVEFIVNCTLE